MSGGCVRVCLCMCVGTPVTHVRHVKYVCLCACTLARRVYISPACVYLCIYANVWLPLIRLSHRLFIIHLTVCNATCNNATQHKMRSATCNEPAPQSRLQHTTRYKFYETHHSANYSVQRDSAEQYNIQNTVR